MRARVRNERTAHHHRCRHAVVRVAAEDGVDAAHASGELEIDVHAVVREQHHRFCALRARFFDQLLQARFLDAERPVGEAMARMRDRRVRERLADDRHSFMQRIRREHRVFEVHRAHVLRQELYWRELFYRLQHALGAIGEFPVRGHVLDAQAPLRADHVGALGPQRRRRALPAVAAIEEQRVRPRSSQPLDQRGEMRVAAHPPVAARRAFEIQMGEGVRPGGARGDAVVREQRFAHQVRRASIADVDARLAEMHWQELRMHVGDVHQRNVAEGGELVQLVGGPGLRKAQACGAHAGEGHRPHEFAPMHGCA